MTVYRISCCTWRSPHIAPADLPTEWQFHRFLLWQLIFHSYSENLSFGRPDLGRSNLPPIQWWFHRFLCNSYFHSYSESSTFGWPGLGRSTPHQMAISQISALTVHISFPTLTAPHLADQVLADVPPFERQFHWFYSDNSYIILTLRGYHMADQVLAYLPPHQMAISQIPALTAHISWQLIFHSYSESSTFGRPGLGRSTPIWVAISLIPTLTTLISFLLWELIIWQTRSWHIYPPSNSDFTDSCSDSSLLWELNIWQTSSWQM